MISIVGDKLSAETNVVSRISAARFDVLLSLILGIFCIGKLV